jgi:ethanolamine kinase
LGAGESKSHCTLSHYDLASPLLARFDNGLLYRFIRGRVCTPSDLGKEHVWRGIARRLGEWHGVLPVASVDEEVVNENTRQGFLMQLSAQSPSATDLANRQAINDISPCSVRPNIWTVMQKWIFALPSSTSAEKSRKVTLQRELKRLVKELGNTKGLGSEGVGGDTG